MPRSRRNATRLSPRGCIAKVYDLAPSKLRVLRAIIDVGGVLETARALGVAEDGQDAPPPCVLKTGASRQCDLVKLVAGFFSDRWTRHWALFRDGLNVDSTSIDVLVIGEQRFHPAGLMQYAVRHQCHKVRPTEMTIDVEDSKRVPTPTPTNRGLTVWMSRQASAS
jgi:hypothetical protein